MIQGSPEWVAARLGKVTASRIADVMARTKTGWGASRANYEAELIAEILTGQAAEGFTSAAMERGKEVEAQARAAYEYFTGGQVAEVGFIDHPTIAGAGASPDGLVGADGLLELKCPNTATHLDTLLGKKVPAKYESQMLWQLACTGRMWCDFVSFDPRLPEHLSFFCRRFHRDPARTVEVEAVVRDFIAQMSAKVAALRALA